MIDNFLILIEQQPLFSILMGIGALFLAFCVRQKARGIKAAELIVEEQYATAPIHLIEEGIEEAKKRGKERLFLALLKRIRMNYGHNGLKMGHIFWLLLQLEGDISIEDVESISIPSFVEPETL